MKQSRSFCVGVGVCVHVWVCVVGCMHTGACARVDVFEIKIYGVNNMIHYNIHL